MLASTVYGGQVKAKTLGGIEMKFKQPRAFVTMCDDLLFRGSQLIGVWRVQVRAWPVTPERRFSRREMPRIR